MKKTLLISAFLFANLVSFSAGKGNDVTTKPAVYFLKSSQVISSYDLLPAPPAVDSIAFLNDKAQYEKGKLLRNTERGKQAYNDAQVEGDGVPRAFSEAFGYTISAQTTPEIFKLVTKLREDAGDLATRSAKQTYMEFVHSHTLKNQLAVQKMKQLFQQTVRTHQDTLQLDGLLPWF